MGVSASNVWARRLGTVLLYNWVAVVLATTGVVCFFLGLFAFGTIVPYEQWVQVSADNRPVVSQFGPNGNYTGQYLIAGTNQPAGPVHGAEVLHPIAGGPAGGAAFLEAGNSDPDRYRDGPGPTPFVWFSIGSLALGLLAGSLCAVFLWHWPRWRYLWCALVVVPPAAVTLAMIATADDYVLIRGAGAGRLAVAFAIQVAGVLVGTQVGRPIARGVARTVIPPKPRQLLAFLWQVDGKRLPAGP